MTQADVQRVAADLAVEQSAGKSRSDDGEDEEHAARIAVKLSAMIAGGIFMSFISLASRSLCSERPWSQVYAPPEQETPFSAVGPVFKYRLLGVVLRTGYEQHNRARPLSSSVAPELRRWSKANEVGYCGRVQLVWRVPFRGSRAP